VDLDSNCYLFLPTVYTIILNQAASSGGAYNGVDLLRLLRVQDEVASATAMWLTIFLMATATVFKLVRTIQKKGRWYNYPITPLFMSSFAKLGQWVDGNKD
jgi:hypothetical protein